MIILLLTRVWWTWRSGPWIWGRQTARIRLCLGLWWNWRWETCNKDTWTDKIWHWLGDEGCSSFATETLGGSANASITWFSPEWQSHASQEWWKFKCQWCSYQEKKKEKVKKGKWRSFCQGSYCIVLLWITVGVVNDGCLFCVCMVSLNYALSYVISVRLFGCC